MKKVLLVSVMVAALAVLTGCQGAAQPLNHQQPQPTYSGTCGSDVSNCKW